MQVQELKREIPLPLMVYLTEKAFLDKYVNENAESSVLRDIYHVGKLES
jgi:hypothetical protein